MNVKLELLQNSMNDAVRDLIISIAPKLPEIADTVAIEIISEIKKIIGDVNLSDFEAIEKIVCLLEEYNVDCGGRHDF